ncbi:MAG: hypothetical protein ACI3YI_13745 [Bacteroidaceae bacterium]
MIIGRDEEQRELHEAYESEYSEFAVVYGRRRVGKTFLVRETFNYNFTFEHSGVAKGNMRVQLRESFSARMQGIAVLFSPFGTQ